MSPKDTSPANLQIAVCFDGGAYVTGRAFETTAAHVKALAAFFTTAGALGSFDAWNSTAVAAMELCDSAGAPACTEGGE
jgi:hypothetical protein